MPSNLEKFRELLKELFQLDQADLDFGIYRIMNTKRDEILRFLDKDLLPQVNAAFAEYQSADKALLQAQVDDAIKNARGLGVDPDQSPKVNELRQKLAAGVTDIAALENTVFSHLFNFFRRYYQDGDFISLRRYKEGVYAIPYEGEEVKLYWANHDQYYIKSSETFRDYTFKLDSGKRVNMRIVAASTEQNNNKEAAGKERRFVLCADNPIAVENGELHIRFEYRRSEGKEKQSELNQQAVTAILNAQGLGLWTAQLAKPAPTENDPTRTVLAKHLIKFTARNDFDYFIHKDLGGFLRRELDFYIKNEVMHLDDIENDTAPRVEQYLSLIRVIRKIAHKIIAFLEQLENFQKKLWLKKKFIFETHYCMTLDRVPEELYAEIAANGAQREEWIKLFAIDEIKAEKLGEVAYTKPLTAAFLKSQPHLVLDTKHFSKAFKQRLLASIEDLDDKLDGLLIHSENFQALKLMSERYREKIGCVYIDPPYNTGGDGFAYRDQFQHSSWQAMMANRVSQAANMVKRQAGFFVSIDENEQPGLRFLLNEILGTQNFIADMVWAAGRKNDSRYISISHEYIVAYVKDIEYLREGNFIWRQRKNGLDEIYAAYARFRKAHGTNDGVVERELKQWYAGLADTQPAKAHRHYCCVDKEGIYFPDNISWPGGGGPRYEVLHPKTHKPVKIPASGWRFSQPEEMQRQIALGRIHFGPDNNSVPCRKSYISEHEEEVPYSVLYQDGRAATKRLRDLLGDEIFENPKDESVLQKIMEFAAEKNSIILDFFAGSGSTAHAVINFNGKDGGSRKYILVEMGEYFNTVLVPRIKKVVYSKDWKDGKPTSRDTGISHAFKYFRLESYEDALANLELNRTAQQSDLLDSAPAMREQYTLSYMLDVESRASQSLLNIAAFGNPDQYQLKVERNGEMQSVKVDLPETFNYLLGLTVKHIDVIRGVRVIDGANPKGDRVLVLWRNLDEMNNDQLDAWFQKQGYNTREMVYDIFYVNGDNNLENLRRPDQTWKVRLIEEEFQRLMFDVGD